MTPDSLRFEDLPQIVTVAECALFTRLAEPTVYAMVRDGRLDAVRGVGRRVLIKKSSIADLIGVEVNDDLA